MKIGVAPVYEPAASRVDGDRRVPARVAVHWQREDLRRQSVKLSHGGHSFPGLAELVVRLPRWPVREVWRPVARLRRERRACERSVLLLRVHMDLRGGEVRQPTRVVEVEVRRHEVAHVLPPEAECLDLRKRRHVRFRRIDRHRWTEERAQPARVTHVVDADARVDEDEPMRVGLDQQAVRDQLGAR
jgi:hypothetical protein